MKKNEKLENSSLREAIQQPNAVRSEMFRAAMALCANALFLPRKHTLNVLTVCGSIVAQQKDYRQNN